MRKLVSIRKIGDLQPITGADAIEVASVDGWKLVVKKGEFKVGDQCVYFEIDSFLPESNPIYAFIMRSGVREFEGIRGHKLRTIKLRGQVSQGLALPTHLFTGVECTIDEHKYDFADVKWQEGDEVTEHLGIKKWEPQIPANMVGQVEGMFPSFIRKTDQERCQNIGAKIFGYDETYSDFPAESIPDEVVADLIEKNTVISVNGKLMRVNKPTASRTDEYEVSMKMDGSSVTYYHYDGKIGVCSRNLELKINEENANNSLVRMFIDSGLMAELPKFGNIAIQGELMGPGIQGNPEGFTSNKYYVFDIFDIDTGEYVSPETRAVTMKLLKDAGVTVDHVPILHASVTLDDLKLNSVDDLLKFAEGPSVVNKIREGLVFKRKDGKFSFKAISNLFLMGEK